jgi:hypothetical protein
MMTAMVMSLLFLVSCIAAAGLIASAQNSAEADQAATGLEVDTDDGI